MLPQRDEFYRLARDNRHSHPARRRMEESNPYAFRRTAVFKTVCAHAPHSPNYSTILPRVTGGCQGVYWCEFA